MDLVLIGLIPGVGDMIGALISSVIISQAARLGAPKALLLGMAVNVAIDALVGTVPMLGDLFDFVWKANQRNVRLLDSYLHNPRRAGGASRLFVWGLGLALIGFVVAVGALGYFLIRALMNISGSG